MLANYLSKLVDNTSLKKIFLLILYLNKLTTFFGNLVPLYKFIVSNSNIFNGSGTCTLSLYFCINIF